MAAEKEDQVDSDGGREYVRAPGAERVPVRLIPYFGWCNRGQGEMSVRLPPR